MREKRSVEESGDSLSAHPTIGLFIEDIADRWYQTAVLAGVADAAEEMDVNLLCFAGGALGSSPFNEFEAQRNVLYDLATPSRVDGLIISGSLGSFVSPHDFERFYDRYHSLPVVSLGMLREGVPSVLVNNERGVYEAVSHLVEAHGRQRIAFIQGPGDNQEAGERYDAYIGALDHLGIRFVTELVAPGDFSFSSGAAAIELLLDERAVKFDAVIAANDYMALGALEALQARKIRVPDDVAVVGFDDVDESKASMPALTTIRQPVRDQGRIAVETLLALLAGESKQIGKPVVLPTMLVERQSCGCTAAGVIQASCLSGPVQVSCDISTVDRDKIVVEVLQVLGISSASPVAEQLLDAFLAELEGEAKGIFLSTLKTILDKMAMEDGLLESWQDAVSVLRRTILPFLEDHEKVAQAEDLWQQARVMVAEITRQEQMRLGLQMKQQAGLLREIGEKLVTTLDLDSLMDVVADELPRLKIPSCSVALYEPGWNEALVRSERSSGYQSDDNPEKAPKLSRFVLGYDKHGRVDLRPEDQVFQSHLLVPDSLFGREQRYSIVVEPLYFRERQYGFALFQMGPRDGTVYEALRGQLGSSLEGALRVQQVRKEQQAIRSLYEASSSVISLRDPDDILQDVVTKASEAVGAQYAAVALMNRGGRLNRLARGKGAEPLATDTLIRFSGLATEVMRSGEPILIEDVRRHTRGSPALLEEGIGAAGCFPMSLRGKPIGVLWVYYESPHFFSDAEKDALRPYINQAAIAYDNARRMHELELLRQTAEKLASVAGVQEVLNQIARSARESLHADSVVIWSYDPIQQAFLSDELIAAGVDSGIVEAYKHTRPRAGGTTEAVIKRGYIAVTDVESPEYEYLGPSAHGLRGDIDVRSFQGIALKVDREALGVLYVNYRHSREFDEEDQSMLATIAHHAALALRKARWLEQMEKVQSASRMVAEAVVQEDLQDTLNMITRGIQSALGCDAVTLYAYNQLTQMLGHPPAMIGVEHPELASRFRRVEPDSIVYEMLEENQPYIVEDISQDELFKGRRFTVDEGIVSCVAVPLKAVDQKVGLMFVNYRTHHRFSDEELDDIRHFAFQAAVAIRNAQLYESATGRADALQIIYEAGKVVTSTLALDEILLRIAQQAHLITGGHGETARFSHIGLVEGAKIYFRARCTAEQMPGLNEEGDSIDLEAGGRIGVTGRAVLTGQSQLVDDVRGDPDYIPYDTETNSELAVPIKLGEQVIGVIDVHHPDRGAFDEEDQQILEFLADQAAIAIRNARLYEEIEYHAVQLATASDVARDAAAILDVRQLLDRTVYLISQRFPFYHAGIFLLDENGDYAVLQAASSEGGVCLLEEHHKLKVGGVGLVSHVATTAEACIVEDVSEDSRYFDNPHLPETRSEIVLPLRPHGRLIGILDVQSKERNAFTEQDVTVLQTMADHLAVAIENARLYEAEQQRVVELAALNTISRSIRSLTSIHEVYQQVNESIAQLVNARMCAVLLYDEAEEVLACQLPIYGVPDDIGQRYCIPLASGSPADEIWEVEDQFIINNVMQSPLVTTLGLEKLAEEAGLRDTLLVKLAMGDRRIGAIQVSNKIDGSPFDEEDTQLLRILADQTSAIIENARLYRKLHRAEGRVGAMMGVAWMGTVAAAWRHAIGNNIAIIEDLTRLIYSDLENGGSPGKIEGRLEEIQAVVSEIREIPMPPLSAEEDVESVPINQLVAERIEQLQLRKGSYELVEYETHLDADDLATVRASPEWLRRVLDILVDNSVQAMKNTQTRCLTAATHCTDRGLEIVVSDTGKGIPEDVQAVLFQEPIKKPKGVKGSGLGLYLAKAIVRTYDGDIEIGSTGPAGTTMTIRLPSET